MVCGRLAFYPQARGAMVSSVPRAVWFDRADLAVLTPDWIKFNLICAVCYEA